MNNQNAFGGIHAVLYALFDKSEALDRGAMRNQVRHLRTSPLKGITVLGLATEVQKLSPEEQRTIIAWAAEDLDGKKPLSVTISGNSVAAQRDLVAFALSYGASWLILQPPTTGQYSANTYLDFFLRIADGYNAHFAVQNAPAYLGRSLSDADISRLIAANDRFSVIKAEMPAVELGRLIASAGDLTVLNGRGGLELTDCLRAGAAGFVVAPDLIDYTLRVVDLWREGKEEKAEAHFQIALPGISFIMQSLEHLICYGKRIYGLRTETPVFDRQPALAPTEFGLKLATRWATKFGPFGQGYDET